MVKETIKAAGASAALKPENTPECLKLLAVLLTNTTKSADTEVPEDLEIELVKGVERVILDEANVQQFVSMLRAAEVSPAHKDVNLAIANSLWIWGTQTDPVSDVGKWTQLASLVKEVSSSGLLEQSILTTSLEISLLVAAGLTKDDAAHQKRLIRINTNLVFKQQKYNALREETEGYSKLSVMLCNEMPQSSAGMSDCDLTATTAQFVTSVFSVVGHFDLEPNRVLDLILDAYEEQPLNRCFIPLIRRFKPTTAAHMLGFKFTMHHVPRVLRSSETDTPAPASAPAAAMAAKVNGSKASAPITTVAPAAAAANASNDKLIINAHKDIVGSDAPQSLYVLAAVLIMNKLVALDDLLPYLRPSLDRLAETIAAIEGGLAKQASAFGVVNLNATKPSGGKEAPLGSAANSGSNNIPVSVDATKEPVVTKVATASGRRPPLPAAPPANSGVTVLPVPPSAKAAAPSTKAVPAVKPPVPSGAPPDSKSGSTAALNRAQSSSKLHGSDKDKMDVVELVDEDAVDESKFTLFFDPAHAAESAQLATGAVESGEVVAEPECPVAVTPRAFCEGNEVVGLIAALLSVRGWQQAKYLLNLLETHGMDPLLVMKYSPDLRTAMAALVDWHVEAAYLSSGSSSAGRGFSKPVSILPVAVSLVGQPSAFKGSNAKAASIDPNSLAGLSAFLKIVPTTSEPQLQQIPSVAEFPLQSSALLSYFGYHLREYPALFARLCRLSKAYVRQLSSPTSAMVTDSTETAGNEAALEPALALISNVLLPALSAYTENNPFLAGQVWDAISGMPFVQRFALYDRWYGGGVGKEGLGSKHSEVVLAETTALHGARAELKRLAKENTKLIGRKLARFTQACPLVVFNYVLGQVEAFDNLIPYMVDALKFSTELSKDVMAYSLVSQLKKGSSGDAKLKKGDTHFSQWFSALTKFIATYYCRYPTTELKGLLNYLLQRLSIGDSLDLLVLKELLGIMGSSETLLEVSPAQLEGLSGGRSLRAEVMGVAGGVVGGKGLISANACRKATLILREELIGSHTAIPLLLMIAQVRSRLLHDAETTQLKLISHLYDTAQDVLMQFTEFLVAGAKSIESIAELMPDLSVLLDEVGLAVPVAFQLVRPLLRAALQFGVNPANAPPRLQRWHPFGETMMKLVTTLIRPSSIWEVMSPRLYVLFWGMGLYDIKVPVGRYEAEIKRLKDKYTELDNKRSGTAASQSVTAAEFSKLNKQRELEMKQLLQKVAELTDDMVRQKKHVEQIREIIRNEQASFFRVSTQVAEDAFGDAAEVEGASKVTATPEDVVSASMLQHLLYQRLLMSPIDAVYCTQFCFLLHEMQTPHFSTLRFLDRTIRTISPLIFCSTESEASFIGYALLDLLQVVNRWHDDEKAFTTEGLGKLGLSSPLPMPSTAAAAATAIAAVPTVTSEGGAMEVVDTTADQTEGVAVTTEPAAPVPCDHAQFKEHCKVWHSRVFQVIRASLTVKDREYIYIRSGLILLAKMSEQFPSRAKEGDQLIALVEKLQALETQRGDLQIMAKSLLTILKKRADSWFNDSPQRKIAAIKAEAARKKAAALAAAQAKEKAAKELEPGESRPPKALPPSSSNAAGDRRGNNATGRDEGLRRGEPSRDSLRGADSASWRQDAPPPPPSRDSRDSRDIPQRERERAGSVNQAPRDGRDGRDSRERRSDSRDRDFRDLRDKDRRSSGGGGGGAGPISAPPIPASSGVKRKGVDDDSRDARDSRDNRDGRGGGGSAAPLSNTGSSANSPPNKVMRRGSGPTATSNAKVDDAQTSAASKDTSASKKERDGGSSKPKQPEKPSTGGANERDRDSRDDSRTERRHSQQESSSSNNRDSSPRAASGKGDNTPAGNSNGGNVVSNKRSRDAADLSNDAATDSKSSNKETSSKRSSGGDKAPPAREGSAAPALSQVTELLAMKDAAKNSGADKGGGARRTEASGNLSSLKVAEPARDVGGGGRSGGRSGGGGNSIPSTSQQPVHKDGLPGHNNLFPPSSSVGGGGGGGGAVGNRGGGGGGGGGRFDDRDRGGSSRGNNNSSSYNGHGPRPPQGYPPQHHQQNQQQPPYPPVHNQHQQYPARGGGGAGSGYDDYHQGGAGGAGGPGGRNGQGNNRRDGGHKR